MDNSEKTTLEKEGSGNAAKLAAISPFELKDELIKAAGSAKVWIFSDMTASIRLDLIAGSDFEPVRRLTPRRFNQCPPNVNAAIARSVAQAFPYSHSSNQLCGLTVLRSQQQPEQSALSKRWDRRRIRVAQPVFMNSVNGTIHGILSLVGSAEILSDDREDTGARITSLRKRT